MIPKKLIWELNKTQHSAGVSIYTFKILERFILISCLCFYKRYLQTSLQIPFQILHFISSMNSLWIQTWPSNTYRGIKGSGIATELRAGRSGIESRWGRDFPPVQIGPGAHPVSCKMGTGSFPGVKCGRDVLLTTHPLLVPRSWKSRAILVPTLWVTPGL